VFFEQWAYEANIVSKLFHSL